ANLFDLQVDSPAGKILQLLLQNLHVLPLLADDQARPRDIENDLHFVARPFDLDPINASLGVVFLRVLFDELANLEVLEQQARKLLLRGVPAALVRNHDSGAEADRMNFLSHRNAPINCFADTKAKHEARNAKFETSTNARNSNSEMFPSF